MKLSTTLCLGAALFAASSAGAAPRVATDSAVYVERSDAQGERGRSRTLEPAHRLSPGDRVITVLRWERTAGDGGFTIVNPLPSAIAYQASAREDGEVSVDGGRTWGRIGQLRIGARTATPEDVTHVRWRVPSQSAARGRGQIAYSGIVR